MIGRHDYRWGHFNNSTFLPILAEDENPTARAIFTGLVNFAAEDPEILPSSVESLVLKAAKGDKFVAILDSFHMKGLSQMQKIHGVKVLSDSLGINGLGLALPIDSELTEI
ncbi:hypothetical protein RRG08_058286 [Elysia crispata]|uniref:Uncharacterized protein n=1 Tax=Elysia crispata TaxID=231223 RepID=A0AAE0YVT2_9GAST|nr:hypothetical protein RRG08_058286 [Elysia crispata]